MSTDDRMLQDHKATYVGFLKFSAYGAAGVALVLILMALFLV